MHIYVQMYMYIINMHGYINSECGHELSGRVRTHDYIIITPWLNAHGLQRKLLITPLSE